MDKQTYYYLKTRMQNRAKVFGIASLATAIIFATVPYLSLSLAGFSLLFAILSRGEQIKFSRDLKIAIGTSIATIVISCYVFFSVFYALKINPEYRENVGAYMDQLFSTTYGIDNTYEADNIYGIDSTDSAYGSTNEEGMTTYSDLLNQLFEGGK